LHKLESLNNKKEEIHKGITEIKFKNEELKMATIEISKLNAELETYLENQEGKREVSIVNIFQIYFIM